MNFSDKTEKLRMKIQLAKYELDALSDKEKELVQKDRTLDQINKFNYKKDIAKKKYQILQSRLSKALEDESLEKSKIYHNDRLNRQIMDKNELVNDYKYVIKKQKSEKGLV